MRILIWGEVKNGGSYDVFRRIDYSKIYGELFNNYHANVINVGNKVWIQGIVSCLSTEDNELFFYNPDETWEQINEKYDKIVYSAANMFSPTYKSLIKEISNIFCNSKIPVYVIAVGAQAKNYDYLEELCNNIREETKMFMDTIYNSGGEIACRGHFTKAFFDRVDNNTAIVTGCPSLFQNGRGLRINKINYDRIIPIFNGHLLQHKHLFKEYPDSVFIDQDEWIQEIYSESFYKQNSIKCLLDLFRKHGFEETELFLGKRIRLFYDVPDWKRFVEKGFFNFTIGTRIHGNIMSLLSRIPSMVLACDSRTMEMAEYFNIPFEKYKSKLLDINEYYEKCDFTKFNTSFSEKFDCFEKFLMDHRLVNKVNQKNVFWSKEEPIRSQEYEDRIHELEKLYFRMGSSGKVMLKALSRIRHIPNPLCNYSVPKETYRK